MRNPLGRLAEPIALGWRVDPRRAGAFASYTILTNLGTPLRALWFKLLIDAVVGGTETSVYVYAIALCVSDGLRSWALLQANMVKLDVQDRALLHLQTEAMRLAGSVPGIVHQEDPAYLDRLTVLRGGLNQLAGAYATAVEAAVVAVRIVATVALLGTIHPLLVLLPIAAIPSMVLGKRAEGINQKGVAAAAPHERAAQYWEHVLVAPDAAKEVRISRLFPVLAARLAAESHLNDTVRTRWQGRTETWKVLGWAVFALGFVAALAFIASRLAAGDASAGDLVLALILGSQVNIQVAEAVTATAALTALSATLDHRRWLADHAAPSTAAARAASPPPPRLECGIRLEGVEFAYPGKGKVLEGVDLELPAGSTVALVGENGAGKTTLVKLLTKLYDPSAGTIRLDDVDLADVDAATWRARVTATFQDFMRYEFTLREVVGLGEPAAIDDRDRVTRALGRAGRTDLIAIVPGGLDGQLGPTFGGTNLSGGQWQQVALARGLMREQPLLQVLDEPTASLDPHAEQAVFESYAAAAERARKEAGAVTLLISHRFSTVRAADVIVVLEHGRVLEHGNHESLMDGHGLYAELYELQARTYR